MSNSWLKVFGFKGNPYDTRTLSLKEGSDLLVGRDDEIKVLEDLLLADARIPLLIGDNGVGKSSIANVVAYRMREEYKNKTRKYFHSINTIDEINTTDPLEIERYVYRQIVDILVADVSFLKSKGINRKQIYEVKKSVTDLFQGGATIGQISIQYQSNPNAERILCETAKGWLQKCFKSIQDGGIIYVIDNIENIGSASDVRKFLESARDTLFNIPGIRWVLCGTSISFKEALRSRILDGYLRPLEIKPLERETVKTLIKQRIDSSRYRNKNEDIPVDSEQFAYLYDIMNSQLRSTLTLCIEFSEHLAFFPGWRTRDRFVELKKWLRQRAAELPVRAYEVPDESWELFDRITALGVVDNYSRDYSLYNAASEDDFSKNISVLEEKELLEKVTSDADEVYRVTKNGWLVHYLRKMQHEEHDLRKVSDDGLRQALVPTYKYTVKDKDLTSREIEEIISYMQGGALCIVPSDSSYILTGLPTVPGVTKDIDALLNRNGKEMSLAFHSIKQAAQIMQLSNMAYSFVNKLTPGAITFVARLSNNGYAYLSEKCLFTDGTIGMRLTDSNVETQIAKGFPIPSVPIRNTQLEEVSDIGEAIEIVKKNIDSSIIDREIITVEGNVRFCGRLSTVVKEKMMNGYWYIEILREGGEGAVSIPQIKSTAHECRYRGVILENEEICEFEL